MKTIMLAAMLICATVLTNPMVCQGAKIRDIGGDSCGKLLDSLAKRSFGVGAMKDNEYWHSEAAGYPPSDPFSASGVIWIQPF